MLSLKDPIFAELKDILAKPSGIPDGLAKVPALPSDRITVVRGKETSSLSQNEAKFGREANVDCVRLGEFREKLLAKIHFRSTVANEKKLSVNGK